MDDDSTRQSVLCSDLSGKPIAAKFDQRHASSDGGAILLQACDRGLGLTEALIESGPFRVLAATASVSSGTGRRSVPRLINYLRFTHDNRRLDFSYPAPGMDHSPHQVSSTH
jgi:hypothetical protein